MSKEVREFIRRLRRAGLSVVPTGGQHFAVLKEGVRVYYFGGSPSDRRWMKNATAELRRKGIDL